MPIYEYRCPKCGYSFERLRSMKDADSDLQCPKCDSPKVDRQFSTFAAASCVGSSRRFT